MYYGITHCCPMFLLILWKKFLCKRNVHCFDEVYSPFREEEGQTHYHYLSCDACNLIVDIEHIDEKFVETGLIKDRQ